jgi:hypothetical protein
VSVHLWDVDGDGWCIHDYLEDNLSAEERAAGKRANNVRQQRRRERLVAAARAAGVTRDSQRDEAVTHTDVTGPTPVPSLPVPSQTRPVPSQGPPDDLSITRTGHSEDDAGRSDAEHIAAIMRRRDELRRAKGYGPA